MKKLKIIFVPGNGGDGNTVYGWFSYLKKEFEVLGCEVLAPVYPDPALARASFWLPFIENLGTDENTVLVGHSSGAIAAMKYAENHKILGTILVAGYHTDLGMETERQSEYFNTPFNWEKIKENQEWIIQFNSTNDDFIPIEEARFVHEKLSSEYYELSQGHFYPQDIFPEIIEAFKKHI
jgi:uncharacterized protein